MCNKVKYADAGDAMHDARIIRADNQHRHRAQTSRKAGRRFRAYQCSYCGYWHLTTQKPRDK